MVYDEMKEGLWKSGEIDTGMLYEEDDTFEDSGDEWTEDWTVINVFNKSSILYIYCTTTTKY